MKRLVPVIALLVTACAGRPVVDTAPTTLPTDIAPTTAAPMATTVPQDQEDELTTARLRWAEMGATSYSYRFLDDCGECDRLPPRRLVVWEGVVVDPLRRAMSIAEAFDAIEAALSSGRTVEASYHPELGYPTDLWVDRGARSHDGGTHLVFDSVEFGLPGSPASLDAHRAARARWEGSRPGAYEYRSAVVCDCEFQVDMRTRVVDGLVTEFETRTPEPTDIVFSPLTITQMFDDVEAILSDETTDGYRVAGSAQYDDRYGYPIWIGFDLEPLDPEGTPEPILPDRLVLTVTAFEPLDISASDDLVAARARWDAAALDSYTFDIVFHDIDDGDYSDEFTVEVVAGRVESVVQNGYDYGPNAVEGVGTVEGLFDEIVATQRAGRVVEVIYDSTLGYPSVIVFGERGAAVSVSLRR